ncbi:MAG: YmdB family metallophosphoesterase, partial [Armatimonadetes bacterium]|nr:YmdB family metallophosphoesterase [Armatimonadota bacterium]
MRVLFVGDIVGRPGRRAFAKLAHRLRQRHAIDFIIANCENAAAGFGVTPDIARELLDAGADCLTSGNHIWKHREIYDFLNCEPRLLRPANYPAGVPGVGLGIFSVGGETIAVANLMGRIHLEPLDCPFQAFTEIAARAREEQALLVVDFHAEATSEKQAFGWYADGRCSAVVGTHTHVQTADERVLPGGAAYITDVGMTGAVDSVLGVNR